VTVPQTPRDYLSSQFTPGLPRRTLAYNSSRFCVKKVQNRLMSIICKSTRTPSQAYILLQRQIGQGTTAYNKDGIVNCISAGLTIPATMTISFSLPGLISLCNGFLQSSRDSLTLTLGLLPFYYKCTHNTYSMTDRFHSSAGTMQKTITGDWQLTIPPAVMCKVQTT